MIGNDPATIIAESSCISVNTLETLAPATDEEVLKIIKSSPSKHCELDPLPTWLLKEATSTIIPCVTDIINTALEQGECPSVFKEALVRPLLKKETLDPEILSNYRPVSNLSYISKVLEKVVAARIKDHLQAHNLLEPLQSAYRQFHSTETALVKVFNDLALALDQRKAAVLVLLDLSAAFDTIDQDILITRCSHLFGISGVALSWIRSYMTGRKQCVKVNNITSEAKNLNCGVPQGSVLGPLLFTMYTTPLGDLLRQRSANYHLYADDTQLYIVFEVHEADNAINQLESTISFVKTWMTQNMLKLNTNKTEFLLISDRKQLSKLNNISLQVGSDTIWPADAARNIGITFDSCLSLIPQISNCARSALFHLRNIGKVRKYLSEDASAQLVHSLVTSRLDYGNALLINLPACHLKKLQHVQNIAAKIVTRSGKYEHITPILKSLHWLPIHARIDYKIALLVYKAMNGRAPSYIQDLLVPYVPNRNLRSTGTGLLQEPKFRTKTYGMRAFSVAAPKLWNSLPSDLRLCAKYDSFTKLLKTYLFTKYYP